MSLLAFLCAVLGSGAQSIDEDSLIQMTQPLRQQMRLHQSEPWITRALRQAELHIPNRGATLLRTEEDESPNHDHHAHIYSMADTGFCYQESFFHIEDEIANFKDCIYVHDHPDPTANPCDYPYGHKNKTLYKHNCLRCLKLFSKAEMAETDEYCRCCQSNITGEADCNFMGNEFCNDVHIDCEDNSTTCTCQEVYQQHTWAAHRNRARCLERVDSDSDGSTNMNEEKCHEEFSLEFMDDGAWHAYCECEHDNSTDTAEECKDLRTTTTQTTTTKTTTTKTTTTATTATTTTALVG